MKLKFFKESIGFESFKYLKLSIIIGFLAFLVESSFVFILQFFLHSIGLIKDVDFFNKLELKDPLLVSVVCLVLFGTSRAIIFSVKAYASNMTQHSFMVFQRKSLIDLALKHGTNISSKEIISIFTDIVTSSGVLVNYFSNILVGVVSAGMYFCFSMYLAPKETLLGFTLVALMLLPTKVLARKVQTLGNEQVKEWENVNNSLLLGIKNNFFLKVYSLVDLEVQRGWGFLDNYLDNIKRFSIISAVSAAIPSFIGVLVLATISFISTTYFKTSPLKLVSFLYIFIRLVQSLSEMNQMYTSCKLNWVGFKHLNEWKIKTEAIQSTSSLQDHVTKTDLISDISQIDVDIKKFTYGQNFNLESILFSLNKGDVLLIKGKSGSGKSTLLSLILGLLKLPEGSTVKVNNKPLTDHTGLNKERIAYVGPEPFLVKGSIRKNLEYGSTRLHTNEELMSQLDIVGMKEKVSELKGALDYELSEYAELSTGQRQRLSITRALLRQFDLLILDEATSNLDRHTEKLIVSKIREIASDKILIVVTHRDSFDNIATKTLNL